MWILSVRNGIARLYYNALYWSRVTPTSMYVLIIMVHHSLTPWVAPLVLCILYVGEA